VKKTAPLLSAVVLAILIRVSYGQETENAGPQTDVNSMPVIKYLWYGFDLLDIRRGIEGKLEIELSTIVSSKHMWHGFDLLDDHGVFLPIGTLTLGNTGFSGKVIGAYALSSGFDSSQELNFAGFYTGAFWENTRWSTKYTANYFYYGKPKVADQKSDTQEIGIGFSWPQLLGNNSLLPNYYFGSIWPSTSQSNYSGCGGFIHVFGLAYDFEVPDFWPGGKEQVFRLSGDITYNDGFGGASHDWSHVVLGASTNLRTGKITITPSLNFQISMDDSVNDEDEIWCGVNVTYRF